MNQATEPRAANPFTPLTAAELEQAVEILRSAHPDEHLYFSSSAASFPVIFPSLVT